jgi:hypothetical protein
MKVDIYEVILNKKNQQCGIAIDLEEFDVSFIANQSIHAVLENNQLFLSAIPEIDIINLPEDFLEILKNRGFFFLIAGKANPDTSEANLDISMKIEVKNLAIKENDL